MLSLTEVRLIACVLSSHPAVTSSSRDDSLTAVPAPPPPPPWAVRPRAALPLTDALDCAAPTAARGQNAQLFVSVACVLYFDGAVIVLPQPPARRLLQTMAENMLEPTIASCGEHRYNKP